jgi:hypothetical protein
VTATRRDLIVMSQSCDLAVGQEKVQEVLLCQLWRRSQVANIRPFNKPGAFSQVAKGQNYGFHLLPACTAAGFESELRIVDFGRVYSLPLPYLRRFMMGRQHLRLLPPYSEHLSQAFARFFMRVGLPQPIPPEQLQG